MRTSRYILFLMLAILLGTVSSAYSQTPLQFVPIAPCRVVDTRNADGHFGGPPIPGGSFRDFLLPNNPDCGIPSTAAAYSLNVTVVPQGPLGFLTVWPTGQTQPVVSTMNSLDGRVKANAAIVPAGGSGGVSVFASNTTNVVLDIDGYFVPANDAALAFYPVTPCRLADTRTGSPLQGGVPQNFTIQGDTCNIPATAAAYSLNFTVIPQGPLGYLTVWPEGQTQPVVSTLNAPTGTTTANAAVVVAGTNGDISAFASNTTDLVIDINGYFAPPGASGQLSLYTLPPCRVLDTRPNGQFSGPITVPIQGGTCNVPSGGAYVLNATVVPQGALGYLTLWPDGAQQPTVSTLNALDGAITSNMAIVPSTNGSIDAFASNPTQLVLDIFSYMAPLPGLMITTTSLPNGQVGQNYPQTQLTAAGGLAPYTWAVTTGNLPPGLSLSTDGVISGMPTMSGAFQFTVQVTDSEMNTATAPLSITVQPAALMITTTSLPNGQVTVSYSATLGATGGVPPYTWSIISGSLPPGLNLTPGSGLISGTPTTSGTFQFTVQVTDSNSNMATAPLSITIQPAPLMITTTTLPNGQVSVPYNATLGATGGTPPYTWSIVSGNLPPGLGLTPSSGLISGTPTTPGVSSFTVQVEDSQQQTAQQPLQIVVDAATTNGSLNGHYAFSFNGYNNGNPVFMAGSFTADGNGNITAGVLDLNTGSGSPTGGSTISPAPLSVYHITADGLGTMTFDVAGLGTMNFHVTVSNGGNGQLIQDNADPNTRGSGVFFVQTPADFAVPPADGYGIGTLGADANLNRYAKAGVFTVGSGGAVSNGSEDINDNGTLSDRTFSGTFSPPDIRSGRGQVSLSFPNGVTNNYAYYVIFKGQFILIGTDPLSANDPLTLGSILVQSPGGFTNASLQGVSVLEINGLVPNGGSPQADTVLEFFNSDSNGSATTSLDENKGGTVTQQQTASGSYSVASNGKVTLTGFSGNPPIILYLTNADQAFVLGQDSEVFSGNLEMQSTPPPFSNLSIFGTYLGGTINPVESPIVDTVNYLLADGNGNINGIQDFSGPDGTGTQNLAAMYQVDSTGRSVWTGVPAGIAYVVSAKKIVLLPSGTSNPALSVFSSGLTN
ncbi:MAG TPA: Ig domain-containing protein [Candidatus Binatia bacterium]|nr:Ig domain-containing protein [Candidatus Binatia bacterium]